MYIDLIGAAPPTSSPRHLSAGFTIDFLLILVLCIVWQLSQWYRALMRRLSSMERLAVTWGRTQALLPPDIAAAAEGEAEGGPAAEVRLASSG